MTDRCEIHGQESVFCYLENRNCDDGRNRPPLPDRTPAHGARREGEPARHATSLGVSGGEIAAAETAPYISGSGKAAAANPDT